MSPVQSNEEDLTRKQRREQARAQRKELEQAEAARAVRRTRLAQLGIVVGIVIVAIVVVLIATGSGGKSKPAPAGSKVASETTAQVNALIGGIPQSGSVLGNPKAPVTLQYFADLECPICKDFTEGALPSLIEHQVREGKLKIEYRSLETATREQEVFRTQQVAALAAGNQSKLWQFVETFYREQGEEGSGYVTEQYLQNIAQQVTGLNLTQWTAARSDPALASQVTNDAQVASAQGFTGTPSFLIGKTGGTPQKLEYASLKDPASFNAAIEKQLKA
ncbi:MAG TPA: thioredoxin domain-containing protein [Solirubrobacteraceae bacterium]|nr:thioredoxin domain-containing protein [Solirubrobacteraceae bacterium]